MIVNIFFPFIITTAIDRFLALLRYLGGTKGPLRRYKNLFEPTAQDSAIDTICMNEGAVMNFRDYYSYILRQYPDLLSFNQLQEILGGTGKITTRSYLEKGYFKYFLIEGNFVIPKAGIIDYLLSTEGSEPQTAVLSTGRRKPGSGCLYQITDQLWEGKYSPRNAQGKRISKNVYARTREECEQKLLKLIYKMNREIIGERIRATLSSTTIFSN